VRYERTFGDIPGYPEGCCFGTRLALSQAGLHRPLVAGISGSGRIGANSVVLAGGYEDTEDFGDTILYTGQGGRDPETGRQVAHQTLTRGNLALACNKRHRLPVRVIRGAASSRRTRLRLVIVTMDYTVLTSTGAKSGRPVGISGAFGWSKWR
jgi:putative restriction endonuclease